MKPIQQQLSTALGDKEPSSETQLVKQVCIIKCNIIKKILISMHHILDDKSHSCKNLV